MRISEASEVNGTVGDGCITARPLPTEGLVSSRVWFDAPATRLAQTNADLEPTPLKDVKQVYRFDVKPPTTLLIEPFFNSSVCYTKPVAKVMCPNGTMGCDPTFGTWGELCPFTSLFGMWYPNTSFVGLDAATGDELWRFTSITPTKLPAPNGTSVIVNITRNYTYYVAPEGQRSHAQPAAGAPELRALRRYEWTQGLPFAADPSTDRFCAVFDYTQDYVPGPPDVESFGPPAGVTCTPLGAVRAIDAPLPWHGRDP
eukprot:CAMPEP_0115842592 /NCGR_PEP_ID=MMETSP0287-20121206/7880_1 /TAXON_ID=412157 /ORGANISM="Chrysochromulina rotalis, Strain UIO044" /LENGTH=256 /DNA_ID=CAMNT_0003296267 /DNA_START=32 /DNA_END=802 /DNA_ORIENTATION=+